MFQEFHKPETVAEAVQLRRRHPSSVYLAGGTGVNSLTWRSSRGAADRAIGIAHLPLGGLRQTEAGLELGANLALQELLEHPDAPGLLARAAGQFANRNVRNMATLGGHLGANQAANLGSASSQSNLIPALMALHARVHLAGEGGEKVVPVDEYVAGHDPADLVLRVTIPAERLQTSWCTRKYGRTGNDVSILAVAVAYAGSPEHLERVAVALGGVAPTAIRLTSLEARLEGAPLPGRDELETWTRSMVDPVDDLRGSSAFKRQVAGALVGWALHNAKAGGKA